MLLVLFKKFLGKTETDHLSEHIDESVEEKIAKIQQGDLRLRNQFIADYQPFIVKMTSRFCKRYVNPESDDEFSVALAAFNEAINQFSPEAGKSFLGFSQTVIRRRLIDYVRKEQRHAGLIPYTAFEVEDEEENIMNPIVSREALRQYDLKLQAEARRDEIYELNQQLKRFGITFSDLAAQAPKHSDSRKTLFQIARILSSNKEMMDSLLHKKALPLKELLEQVTVSRKTLERNRKFIIAAALIYHGPYPFLQDYLRIDEPEGGVRDE